MLNLSRIVLAALMAFARLSAATSDDESTPAQAYDITVTGSGGEESALLVFAANRVGLLPSSAPLQLAASDAPSSGEALNIWMPCTTSADGSFSGSRADVSIIGTMAGGRMSGTLSDAGATVAFHGVRSRKHYSVSLSGDAQSMLDRAREQQLARRPKQAMDLFRKVIEADRYDMAHAAPALVGLVACAQLLKDDSSQARRATELMKRFLSDPLPLDGAQVLDLGTAEQDLLWKEWPPPPGKPAKPPFAFTLDKAERQRQLQHGVLSVTIEVNISVATPAGMHFVPIDMGAREAQACSASATLPDGTVLRPTQSSANNFAGLYNIYLTFSGAPAEVKSLAKVSGTLMVSQEQEWELKRIPLHEGETWETLDAKCQLNKVSNDGGTWRISVIENKKGPVGGGSTSTSSSSVGGGGGLDSPRWLSDGHGARMLPRAVSLQGTGSTSTITMTFAAAGAASEFVQRCVTKVSTRPIRFSLEDVELP
jgi:hypothetical protein